MEPGSRCGQISRAFRPSGSAIASSGDPARRSVSSSRPPTTSQRTSLVSVLAGAMAGHETGSQFSRPGARTGARMSRNSGAPSSVTMNSVPAPPAGSARWSIRYSTPRRRGVTTAGAASGSAAGMISTSVVSLDAAVMTTSSPLRAVCSVSSNRASVSS